jgi:RimJ/RimL family protein N-acetyltransferase
MLQELVKNWSPRLPMTAPSLIGRYVRTDPLDISRGDVPLLWDALGGNDDDDCSSINERLKWFGLPDFHSPHDLTRLLETIQQPTLGCCVNVFRLVVDDATAALALANNSKSSNSSTDNNNNPVVGMASYIATNPEHGTTEVGYVAHGAAMEQTAAATEAHYLLAKHVFEGMGYRRYEWKCNSSNERSCKAALRYGFAFEGCFRQHRVTAKGHNRDTNWYSMLDSEWPSHKQAMEAWLQPSNFEHQQQQPNSGKQKQRLQDFQTWKKEE